MAGSAMTFAYDRGQDLEGLPGGVRKVTVSWTSDSATGAVTGTTAKIVGRLIKGVTVPSGSAAPTNLYDINITDEQSVDVLAGCKVSLVNRSSTNTEEQYFLVLNNDTTALSMAVHPAVCNALTVAVTNAGNSKAGTIVLYYLPG